MNLNQHSSHGVQNTDVQKSGKPLKLKNYTGVRKLETKP